MSRIFLSGSNFWTPFMRPMFPSLDQVRHGDAVRAVFERDLHDEAQIAFHEAMGGPRVSMVAELAREPLLLVDGEERDAVDVPEILVEGARSLHLAIHVPPSCEASSVTPDHERARSRSRTAARMLLERPKVLTPSWRGFEDAGHDPERRGRDTSAAHG
jgi:hypothetical protein